MKTQQKTINQSFVIGIDEVGRGAIAGPLTVGAVCIPRLEYSKEYEGLQDSKLLSAKQREVWRSSIMDTLYTTTTSIPASVIDTIGIQKALHKATHTLLSRLIKRIPRNDGLLLVDKGIPLFSTYIQEYELVKGDTKEPVIAYASIIAKTTRDRYMCNLNETDKYSFASHKGYGTQAHYNEIHRHGISPLHRHTFIHIE